MLRAFCLGLPACTEDVKWGDNLVFSIGEKMFCMVSLNPPFQLSFKVKDEEFEELGSRPGFIPAPYMARAKWVMVLNPAQLHKNKWQHYIRQSYDLVKARLTKKVKAELGI